MKITELDTIKLMDIQYQNNSIYMASKISVHKAVGGGRLEYFATEAGDIVGMYSGKDKKLFLNSQAYCTYGELLGIECYCTRNDLDFFDRFVKYNNYEIKTNPTKLIKESELINEIRKRAS